MKVTLSVIKADIGGYVGHSTSHPEVLAKAEECLRTAKRDGLLIDYHVTNCGDTDHSSPIAFLWRRWNTLPCRR